MSVQVLKKIFAIILLLSISVVASAESELIETVEFRNPDGTLIPLVIEIYRSETSGTYKFVNLDSKTVKAKISIIFNDGRERTVRRTLDPNERTYASSCALCNPKNSGVRQVILISLKQVE